MNNFMTFVEPHCGNQTWIVEAFWVWRDSPYLVAHVKHDSSYKTVGYFGNT